MEEKVLELLKKNLELSKEIYKMVKSIRHYIFMQRVWGVLKIILILTPIILGIIYLPPFLSGLNEKYNNLLNFSANPLDNIDFNAGSIDLDDLSPELQKLIK